MMHHRAAGQAMRWWPRLARGARDCRGASSLEFAIIGTLMAGAVAALVDLGNVAQQRIQLQEAVRAGGSYAALHPADTNGIKAAIKSALPSAWSSSVTTTAQCFCVSTTPCATSGAPCATNVLGLVTLSASVPYTPIMSSISSNTASYVVRFE